MNEIDLMDLVTLTTASKLRGVSFQAIQNLVRRRKLSVVEIDGVKFVKRSEIISYKRGKSGKKPKIKDENK